MDKVQKHNLFNHYLFLIQRGSICSEMGHTVNFMDPGNDVAGCRVLNHGPVQYNG